MNIFQSKDIDEIRKKVNFLFSFQNHPQ